MNKPIYCPFTHYNFHCNSCFVSGKSQLFALYYYACKKGAQCLIASICGVSIELPTTLMLFHAGNPIENQNSIPILFSGPQQKRSFQATIKGFLKQNSLGSLGSRLILCTFYVRILHRGVGVLVVTRTDKKRRKKRKVHVRG